MPNPLVDILTYGQSIWYGNIRRGLITSGELQRFVEQDGLRGVTSNPAIFEKAIAGSTDYDDVLKALERGRDMDAKMLAIGDIQAAAGVMRPVYEKTNRRDGYVSLEVSPYLATDTQGTIEEARRLWKAVGRPNVMIQVPATPEGIPAIAQLIGEGINVNVTLLFPPETYERVADAYMTGLEKCGAKGGDVSTVASVASFFISRIDTAIDAIANARLTYQRYKELHRSARWQALATKGAQMQRLLWARTSTKNPNWRDVLYVEELIGPDTVNTVPTATFDAFRDHGRPRPSLEENLEEAHDTMEVLAQVGISMQQATDHLLAEGVKLFADAFDKLLSPVEREREALLGATLDRHTYQLPEPLAAAVIATLEDWRVNGKVRRLWARDASLWTGADEGSWLGWLGITDDQLAHIDRLRKIAEEVKNAGFSHALLLGMGGSSPCPEVMKMTFGRIPGYPELHVLDSTDPAQVQAFEGKVELSKTLFIVSSKSGSTLEPNIFKQYFFERVQQTVGAEEASKRFIAITDQDSKLQHVAEHDGFRYVDVGTSGGI